MDHLDSTRPTMSFRQRFVLIIGLTGVMILAAGVAFRQLLGERDEAREAVTRERGEALAATLAQRLRGMPGEGAAGAVIEELLASDPGASAGLCARDGEVTLARTAGRAGAGPREPRFGHRLPGPPPLDMSWPGPPDWGELPDGPPPRGGFHGPGGPEGGPSGLLPADRDLIAGVCQQTPRALDGVGRGRAVMPRDVLLVSVTPLDERRAVWTLLRLPPPAADASQRGLLGVKFGLMGLASLLLVLLTLDALLALRRGTTELEGALVRLQADLRAAVPQPRSRELGRIAAGIRGMAAHLADARQSEAALARQVGHEERLAALGRVVAGVAHEVRNPLTGLKLKLDGLVRRRRLDERSGADVAVCLQEIARLERIVSSLLVVARTARTDRASIDLGALVDERIGQAAALALAGRVALRREGEGAVEGSREVVVQVLDNVLRNAIEASPAGGEVVVRVAATGHAPRVEVIDAGPGLPEDRVAELFEPFFTLKPEGVGLGLFSSRALMQAQGWGLRYERRAAATVFLLQFPPSDPHAEARPHPGH